MRTTTLACALAVGLGGCTCGSRIDIDGSFPGQDSGSIPGQDSGSNPGTDGGLPPIDVVVYAHSASTLYEVDPDTLVVTEVAPFTWPAAVLFDSMTDIAIDQNGVMIGISFTRVFAVDSATAVTTYLSDLDRMFNGLSFVPAEQFEPTGAEILVAAALDGSFYQLDPTTGASTAIGNYGGGLQSSGDIVSVRGLGTVATVNTGTGAIDSLAWVDPMTGVATIIGATNTGQIWGLGFWEDKVFGFTEPGQFVLIDVMTGAAMVIETSGVAWWGAGVTTEAPVIL